MKVLLAAHEKAHGILDGGAVGPQRTTAEEPGLAVGTVIAGRYKVLESLGEGGMGTVFVAEQTQPVRRKVALKLIKAGMDSTRVLARFEAERQALALMDHPNIAKVLDGGLSESDRPYFVMEYIRGVPLTEYSNTARLSVRQRLELFLPVCQAVQHAHQKGIIHRDLKPSNILVALYDGKPVPKVIDFGLAKAIHQPLTERTLYTAHEMIVGTPLYMSPEQAELNNLDIDTRADIYALGVILYELLTGETPLERGRFRKAAWDQILRIIREEEPPRPSTRLSGLSNLPTVAAQRQTEPVKLAKLVRGELDWIVMKALEKDRNRRYETANGFAMDVQRYLAEEPVLAGPPTASYRLRKFLRRNKKPVLALSVLLLALVGGIAGTTWGLLRAIGAEAAAREAEAQAVADREKKEKALVAEAEQRAEADRRRREADDQKTHALKAEKEAKEQAAIALAVNEFLQKELLGQADIGNQPLLAGGAVDRNPNVTVKELLDRAARGIEGKFSDQPLTEAAIRLTIGDAYRALGRYAEAQPHLERSIQLRTAQQGADHPDTLTSKSSLAVLYLDQGEIAKAEPLCKEVLQARTDKQGADHPETLRSKSNLASLYSHQGQYPTAERLFREALQGLTASLGGGHRDTLATKSGLALLFYQQGQYPRAETLFKEVLETTAKLGADHPDTLRSKNNVANMYRVQGQYAEAEPLFKEGLELSSAKLGANHPLTLAIKNNLGLLYHALGQYAKAEPLFKEVLEANTAQLGANHLATLTIKNNLGLLYHALGQYAKAEPLFREVLEGRTAKLRADHPLTLNVKNNLAALYLKQGQYAVAEPLFKEVLEARAAQFPADHPNTLESRNNLAVLYVDTGQYAKAEPLYKEVLKVTTAKLGPDHPSTLASNNNLADLYVIQGQYAKAEELLREALDKARKKHGLAHPVTQTSIFSLADCYEGMRVPEKAELLLRELAEFGKEKDRAESIPYALILTYLGRNLQQQKKAADAEPILRDSLAIREKKQPDAWTTFNTQSMLGGALLGQKKYDAAEPLLLKGYEGMKQREAKIPAHAKVHLTEALERVVQLYDATGQKDKADEWRKKLEEAKAAASSMAKP
jgi:serine/threonine protein kinase/Tfp pilus assembly protein PilF